MSIASYENILFVDYENAGKVDFSVIPADLFVPFFFGASQKSVPTEFLKAVLNVASRFLPIGKPFWGLSDKQEQGRRAR